MSLKWFKKFRLNLSSMILGIALLTAVLTSSAGFFALFQMNSTNEIIEEWLPRVSKMGEIGTNVGQFRIMEWEYLNATDDAARKHAESGIDESSGNIFIYSKVFSKLIDDNKTQVAFDKYSGLWEKYIEQHDKFLTLAKAKKNSEAIAILVGATKFYEDSLAEIKNMSELSYQGSLSAKKASDQVMTKARWLVGMIAGVSLVISILMAWLVARFISKKIENISVKLNDGARVLNNSIIEISTSSSSLSESVTEQVSALYETVASISEISNKVDQNNEGSSKTLAASNQSLSAADEGSKNMNEVMSAIKNISGGMNELLENIETSHNEVSQIINIISAIDDKTKVINDIVFQTKLLSFNASVEAARAGEHGKGFAVVAEEIGKLAQMSGDSASEIRSLLESSTAKVHDIVERAKEQTAKLSEDNKKQIENGNKTVQRCNTSLQEIRSNINEVNNMIEKIASSSLEQGHGLKEVSSTITQLHDSTSHIANIAQMTSQEAKVLDQQAKEQAVLIKDLRKLI